MAIIQFSHANGFPAKTYLSFFKHFPEHDFQYVNAFGIGDYRIRSNWYPLIDELIASVEAHGHKPVIGMGHSLGSVLTYWAAKRRPDLFSQVIMMDPPYLPAYVRFLLATLGPIGLMKHLLPISKKASKRKDHFQSREEAFDYWRPKKLFDNFSPESFQDYVDHTLVSDPKGGLRLLIPKDLEAKIFSLTAWKMGQPHPHVPVYWLVPEQGVVPPETIEKHKENFPDITFISVKGSHMFPLEYPRETAELVKGIFLA